MNKFNKSDQIPTKNLNSFTKISEITGKISLNHPLILTLKKIINYNKKQKFLTCLLKDSKDQEILGFFYVRTAEILNLPEIRARIPFQITIFKAQLKTISQKQYIEIHHAILDNATYINSNWIGGYQYCEMQAFLQVYIKIYQDPNTYQLWGNLFHDYLSNFYSNIYSERNFSKNILHNLILAAFVKACYQNWRLLVTLGKNIEDIIKEFSLNYLQNELEFAMHEIDRYNQEYGNWRFKCEIMLFSKNLGIQGRIDRYIQNLPFSNYNLYETKTGSSPRSSQITAFFQSMAYATILKEHHSASLEQIYIEYPKLPIKERLISYDFEYEELLKVLKMRNEIWAILMGHQPIRKKMLPCGRCSVKNACDFYEFRVNFLNPEYEFKDNQFYEYYVKNNSFHTFFPLINAYYVWFSSYLDQEYLRNIDLINESHLPAVLREKRGNALASMILDSRKELTSTSPFGLNQILSFTKQENKEFEHNRMRIGDHVLVTPSEFSPNSSHAIRGIITNLQSNQIDIRVNKTILFKKSNNNQNTYRIDLSTSNYMVGLQKKTLDFLLRYSKETSTTHVKKLLEILLFNKILQQEKVPPSIIQFSDKSNFDPSQKKAITTALKTKDLCLIQGPPGTGKTTIIINIIQKLIQKFKLSESSQKDHSNNLKVQGSLDSYLKTPSNYIPPKKPLLLSTYTNKALDNILLKLLKKYPSLRVVRLGKPESISDSEILSINLEYICSFEKNFVDGTSHRVIDPLKARLILEKADIIATTTTTAGNVLLNYFHFDSIILDEAGQIVETSALIPLVKGNHYILVGDHLQLPPISSGQNISFNSKLDPYLKKLHFDSDRGLDRSIFERLAIEYQDSNNFCLLTYQYRMNKTISDFISEIFYHKKLKVGNKNIGNQTIADLFDKYNIKINAPSNQWQEIWREISSMIFLDTIKLNPKDSTEIKEKQDLESIYNMTEVKVITKLLSSLLRICLDNNLQKDQIAEILSKIGIISGYRAQNQQIRNALLNSFEKDLLIESQSTISIEQLNEFVKNRLLVDTVDRFQGREREIILYSFVDSNHDYRLNLLNLDPRRLNVAVSRAKKKIIFVGHTPTLCEKSGKNSFNSNKDHAKIKIIHRQLVDYIQKKGKYYSLSEEKPFLN